MQQVVAYHGCTELVIKMADVERAVSKFLFHVRGDITVARKTARIIITRLAPGFVPYYKSSARTRGCFHAGWSNGHHEARLQATTNVVIQKKLAGELTKPSSTIAPPKVTLLPPSVLEYGGEIHSP